MAFVAIFQWIILLYRLVLRKKNAEEKEPGSGKGQRLFH